MTTEGWVIDQIETGVTVQMTSTAFMKSVLILLGSYVNSATTKYTFSITATVPAKQTNYVVIQFPSQVILPSNENSLNC